MRKAALVAILLTAAAQLRGQGASAIPLEWAAGRPVPVIAFLDDSGASRSTAEWQGVPTVLAPIFTRCPLACPLITKGLIRAAAESKARPGTYRVVLFSFDPRDTPDVLHAYRERMGVPLAWTVATASPADTRKLLDAVGYSFAQADGTYTHPNLVVAISADMKTASYMLGTTYELDDALAVARGRVDWVARWGGVALALLLLVCSISAVSLLVLIGGKKEGSGKTA